MPSAFTLSGVVHKITAYQVSVPLSLMEGLYEEPVEKDTPPFKLKSRHLLHCLQATSHNSTQLKDGRGGKVSTVHNNAQLQWKNMQFDGVFFPAKKWHMCTYAKHTDC